MEMEVINKGRGYEIKHVLGNDVHKERTLGKG